MTDAPYFLTKETFEEIKSKYKGLSLVAPSAGGLDFVETQCSNAPIYEGNGRSRRGVGDHIVRYITLHGEPIAEDHPEIESIRSEYEYWRYTIECLNDGFVRTRQIAADLFWACQVTMRERGAAGDSRASGRAMAFFTDAERQEFIAAQDSPARADAWSPCDADFVLTRRFTGYPAFAHVARREFRGVIQ